MSDEYDIRLAEAVERGWWRSATGALAFAVAAGVVRFFGSQRLWARLATASIVRFDATQAITDTAVAAPERGREGKTE